MADSSENNNENIFDKLNNPQITNVEENDAYDKLKAYENMMDTEDAELIGNEEALKAPLDDANNVNDYETQPNNPDEQEVDLEDDEENIEENKNENAKKERKGFIRLPLAKIKNISKLDQEFRLCQKNAYIMIGKLTELFISQLARDSVAVAKINKRKTLNIEDITCALKSSDKYSFIDIKSIFSFETIEEIKEKEDRLEKKLKKAEKGIKSVAKKENNNNNLEEGEKNEKSTYKNKEKKAAKNNNPSGNMTIDSMFANAN